MYECNAAPGLWDRVKAPAEHAHMQCALLACTVVSLDPAWCKTAWSTFTQLLWLISRSDLCSSSCLVNVLNISFQFLLFGIFLVICHYVIMLLFYFDLFHHHKNIMPCSNSVQLLYKFKCLKADKKLQLYPVCFLYNYT